MAPLWMIVFGISVMCVSGQSVNLNDTVQLTVNGSCAAADMQLEQVLKAWPKVITRTVARLVRGEWEPAEHYKDRIHHVTTSTVNLTRANFNDNNGAFEFICNSGRIGNPIQLTVVFPHDVRVSERETATIPCHSSTEGVQGVWWERDGERVHVQNRSSGQPEGRLSVSPDWVQTGDLSLTVEDAQLEDGGSYVCYTVDGNGEKTRGSPAAVKVTVQRKRPAPTEAPQQPTPGPDGQQTGPGLGLIVSIIFNVLLFSAAASFCALWRVSEMKTRGDELARPAEKNPLGRNGSNGVV